MMNQDTPYQNTPPSQPTPPAPGPVPYIVAPPPKVRRVGTFTTGLLLITGGILLLLAIFLPQINLFWLFRFSPIILVSLGIEVLIFNIRYKDAILKYDFLSILLCFFLIFIGGVGSVSSYVVDRYGHTGISNSMLSKDLEASAYEALKDNSSIKSIRAYVDFDWWATEKEPTPQTLGNQYTTHYTVVLKNQYASAEDFAADCYIALDALRGSVAHIDYISFSSDDGTVQDGAAYYSLYLDGRFETDAKNSAELVPTVEVNYLYEEGEDYIPEVTTDADEEDMSDPESVSSAVSSLAPA